MSIQFKFFTISSRNHQEAEEDLNKFLHRHKVTAVHREFVTDKENSFWSIAVEYLEGTSKSTGQASVRSGKKRVDYKELLSPEDFSVFATLREWRKQTAEEAGVPVYTIFTNEQLATIITKRVRSKTDLGGIEGIGEARIEKYGDTIVQFMRELTPPPAGSE